MSKETRTIPIHSACKFCGEKISLGGFKDFLSLQEYFQSGLCQDCQDGTFLTDWSEWYDPEDDYDGRF